VIGRTLGHYRIVEPLGAGGMGEVYRAHDERLDRDVALKVLPEGALSDEEARKRFRKEAHALTSEAGSALERCGGRPGPLTHATTTQTT